MPAPRTMAAFAAASLAATAVVFPVTARAQYRMGLSDCSQFTTDYIFRMCMENNRHAINFNQASQASERQSCLNRIDQARALAARGDMRGWNRVPTRCLY